MIRWHCCQSPGPDQRSFRNFSEFAWEHQSSSGVYPPNGQDLPVRADIEEPPRMSTSDRADLHRMATQIALSYARCHNETFDAFPALFQTAYHGLLSCSQPAKQEPAAPAKKAVAAPRPVAQPKRVVQNKPMPPARAAAPAKTASAAAPAQRKPASGTGRGWPTWTGSMNKPGRPPKNGAGSKNGAGRYR
jgi:hypothetical protein